MAGHRATKKLILQRAEPDQDFTAYVKGLVLDIADEAPTEPQFEDVVSHAWAACLPHGGWPDVFMVMQAMSDAGLGRYEEIEQRFYQQEGIQD
jgi:hypothetical protein